MSETLPIGKTIKYYNLATNETVKLKIVNAEKWCKGCYFSGKERHCPDDYPCGPVAREDKTAIIFKYIGDVK